MDDMEDIKQEFFIESSELLVDMEERLLRLDINTQNKDEMNAIFRCAHSIKGGSGAFGMDQIMHFTHNMEAILDVMREGTLMPSREIVDMLLKSVDVVKKMMDCERGNTKPPAEMGTDVIAALQQLMKGGHASVPALAQQAPVAIPNDNKTSVFDIIFTPHETLIAEGNEPLLILQKLASLGTATLTADVSRVPALHELGTDKCLLGWTAVLEGKIKEEDILEIFEFVNTVSDIRVTQRTNDTTQVNSAQSPAANAAPLPAEESSSKSSTATSIRVDLEKVDRLVNMVGELVITEAMLRDQVRNMAPDQFPNLLRGVDELSHHTRELQEAVMAVRMQPVKSIFSRMPRIVRDTSSQLGKDIQIILSGENTEVDKTVIEQLGDPLTHMIRNSCDHGIEKPDERAWHEKPLQGTIHLSAYHRSGRIIIEISDDGAGINREKVLNKAREKGLVSATATLTDEEIDHLIFLPGFSTAEQVTSVSGRGVGMDVVRRNIENLGGSVRITNNPGKGSVFTVSLPLTLAILDGMIVRVGTENYIVPITNIIETLSPNPKEINRVEGRGEVLNVRGEFVPLIHLTRIFGIPDTAQDATNPLIVLVESSHGKLGLIVDELIGQQQVVIKSLEANTNPVKGISGATILGDGRVSLILEINELRQLCQPQMASLSTFKAA